MIPAHLATAAAAPTTAAAFDPTAAFAQADSRRNAGDPLGAVVILQQAAQAAGSESVLARLRQAMEATLAAAAHLIVDQRIDEGLGLFKGLFRTIGFAFFEGGGHGNSLVEADLALRRAASIAPGLAPVYQAMGVLRFRVGQFQHAVVYFERCLARFEPTAAFYGNLGMALKQNGRIEPAERAFLAAIALDPTMELAKAGLLYCREIQDKHLDLASILQRIGSSPGFFFVQIGAMDGVSFDPIHPHIRQWAWSGLVVEPNPESFAKLRRTYADAPGIQFEEAAVTETCGRTTLRFVSDAAVHAHGLETTTLGMARIDDAHSAADLAHVSGFARFAETVGVDCLTLPALLDKHKVSHIDLLQIDTEGYDWKVLRQLDFTRFRPSVINLEVIHISLPERIALMTRLREHGYLYAIRGIDMLAVRADVLARVW